MPVNGEINALKGQTIESNNSETKRRVRQVSSLGHAIASATRQLERGKHSVKNRYDKDNDDDED